MTLPDKVTMHFNSFPEPECAALYIRRDAVDWEKLETVLNDSAIYAPECLQTEITSCLEQIRAIK